MTLQDIPNAISSQAVDSGPSRLDLPDGQMTDLFGPVPVPASRSRRLVKGSEPMIQGICGRTFIASSESADQPLFLESKSPTPPGPEGPLMFTCVKCGIEKLSSDFYRNRGKHANSSGYHAQCKKCCKERQAAYRTGTKQRRSDSHRKYREQNRARVLVNAARTRAKQANIPFDLDEHVDAIQVRIDRGFCELTGLPLRVDGGRTWDSPSLDRIVPELGYEITNVRVVLFAVNVMMNTWGEEPILTVANAIRSQREEDEKHPLYLWEQRLKERLASIGSTESALIWTRSVTPQGFPISRLAVSTRHTNGTGYTGSQWSTPRASDGENRTLEMMKAYMPTPTVADVQGGRKARSGTRSSEPLLNGLCYEMEPIGRTPLGSPATTARRGAPNPVFAFWLMGFPAEWISGALAAMQSYRKPRRKS